MQRSPEKLRRLEQATEVPLLALAVAMVPLLLAPLLLDLSPQVETAIVGLDWMIWAVFAADLAARTYLAPERIRYLRQHWVDVLIVALPFLRPLRAVRLLRFARVLLYLVRSQRSARTILARRGVHGALVAGAAAVVVSATVVYYAERDSGGPITGVETAAWWALATVTTVGYGDTYPVTALGRGVATFLMLVGIGLFGLLTAQVAAYFVETGGGGGSDEPSRRELMDELHELRDRLEG